MDLLLLHCPSPSWYTEEKRMITYLKHSRNSSGTLGWLNHSIELIFVVQDIPNQPIFKPLRNGKFSKFFVSPVNIRVF